MPKCSLRALAAERRLYDPPPLASGSIRSFTVFVAARFSAARVPSVGSGPAGIGAGVTSGSERAGDDDSRLRGQRSAGHRARFLEGVRAGVGAWVVEGVARIEDPESRLERVDSEAGQKVTLTAGANFVGEIVPTLGP
jgi:hypothetical protein